MTNNPYATLLNNLRNTFIAHKVDGFLFTTNDEYINEYVPEYYQRLPYLTGFKGSFGLVIVLKNKAAIFVDGRYTLQAKNQVDATLYDILPYEVNAMEEWLKNYAQKSSVIGVNTKVASLNEVNLYNDIFTKANLNIAYLESHLVDEIWQNRPLASLNKAYVHNISYTGISYEAKIKQITEKLKEHKQNYTLITALDSIAWLLNIRGNDVAHNPLLLSKLLLKEDSKCYLFVNAAKITEEVKKHFNNHVEVLPEESLLDFLTKLDNKENTTIALDNASPAYYTHFLKKLNFKVILQQDHCQPIKCIKTTHEITNIKNAHIRDGVALTKLIYLLDNEKNTTAYTEVTIDDELHRIKLHLDEKVFKLNRYKDSSFSSIIGVNDNGAIIHYRAEEQSAKKFDENGYLLIDCGSQYLDGTTDVTRTLSFNKQSHDFKTHFTLVLKGHIALAKQIFKVGTKGNNLDILARQFLWQMGLDYNHGTGHGVGYFLGVHEGPASIAMSKKEYSLFEGMVLSNEPGFYVTSAYGIRLENLYVIQKSSKYEGFLEFEPLTLTPFDMKNVILDLLDKSEISWLNYYHNLVYSNIEAYLTMEEKTWFKQYTLLK